MAIVHHHYRLLLLVLWLAASTQQLRFPSRQHGAKNGSSTTVLFGTTESTTVSTGAVSDSSSSSPSSTSSSVNHNNLTVNSAVVTETSSSTFRPVTEAVVAEVTEPDRGIFENILGFFGINAGGIQLPSLPQPPAVVQPNPPQPPSPPHVAAASEPASCGNCKCGITYLGIRIVGGQETKVNEYPWMTILRYNNRFYCGASAINNYYLLTAAHCVHGFQKEKLSAVFLEHDQKNPSETKTYERRISKILRHRYYNTGGTYNNDIALLKLDKPLNFNDGITKPVCLPTLGKSYTNFQGVVIGWGATQESGSVADKLQEVEVPIMSNADCRKTGYDSYKITDNMLCAGYPKGMKDSCQGDSGGPLHIRNNTIHQIVGIVSWGEGCAEPNYPGVYTRVNRYITWIKSNTQDACYCVD